MGKAKVLLITQEMEPYTAISEITKIVSSLPQKIQSSGMEIRLLMPRFGLINERRHRLHEVVRLSGMNIIVDDDDYPLIIKVASLPNARIQVYFLDNEDFFKRKYMYEDEAGVAFEDNAERMIFFCKGAIETVKKFGWPPDIIHCNGWMTGLIPLYIKEAYKSEPLFEESKIIYSVFESKYDQLFDDRFFEKAAINDLEEENVVGYKGVDKVVDVNKGACLHSDAIIVSNTEAMDALKGEIDVDKKEVLKHSEEGFLSEIIDFYNSLIPEEGEDQNAE